MYSQLKSEYIFGVNLSTMTIKASGTRAEATTPVGIHFGRYFEIPVTSYFAVQPSFLFSAKGTDYTIDTLKVTLSPVYIEIPVNAQLNFGKRKVRASIFAGSYFAVGIDGYKIVSGGAIQDLRFGASANKDLKPIDLGLNLGARLKVKGIMLSVQYCEGFSNISPQATSVTHINNRVIAISICATGLGKK